MTGDRPGVPTGADIQVLFVDDSEQWAEVVADDIESEASGVHVTVVGNAYDALEALSAEVDCIVADYRMPGKNGIELLERVREEYPRLPYLLVTSQGSETVASRALDAGVTDYLIKDPRTDQTTYFVNKIRTSVEHDRLQRAIEESEERYRTVTEQSRDAIGILRNRRLVFCNKRMVEITGRNRQQLLESDTDLVAAFVHSEDRERVGGILDNWSQGEQERTLHEARLVRPDGTIRHCEYVGRSIEYEGDPATLLSIRDVTERQRRERELQWERELNRTIQRALVEARTRSSLECEVVEQLRDHGYALSWVAERLDDSLVSRAVAGDDEYVEALDQSMDDDTVPGPDDGGPGAADGLVGEPSRLTARTGEPQFVQDIEDLPAAEWREAALDCGYRSGAAVPLVYNDVAYGLLAVYHEQPDRFDETEQRLLTELADTVAFAVHSLETQSALAADHAIEVTLQVEESYYLVDLARDGAFGDAEEVRVDGTVLLDEEAVVQYLTVHEESISSVRDALDGHPDVTSVVGVGGEDSSRLQVTTSGPVPESLLAARGVIVYSTTVEPTGATIELELPPKKDVRFPVTVLDESFGGASVLSVTEREEPRSAESGRGPGTANLTDKQLAALKTAYFDGYFEQPRGSSASEVADSLGVTHSTFLRHLRAAQAKVFEDQFE